MALLLLVEDERLLRWSIKTRLERAGHAVSEAVNLAEAEEVLQRMRPQVVLLDVNLPDGSGIDFLAAQGEKLAESTVLMFTAAGRVEDAVRAIKLGAWDFLTKPVDQEELLRLVEAATMHQRDSLEVEASRRSREVKGRSVVGESPSMNNTLRLAETVAHAGSTTVLIQGETGVGKEVVARYIHARSPRASAPLQALNCAAVPDHLVESELFGYEKGAFTDAKASRKGLFELADGGTVILDEICELPLPLQAKLLRFLEERVVRRLGAVREIPVDVRVLALTNLELDKQVAAGKFREDLFYRLNVFPITVPSLRERREDIIPLAREFMRQFGISCGKRFVRLTPEFETRLAEHHWTGNVRELRNLIERAVILETGDTLSGASVSLAATPNGNGRAAPSAEKAADLAKGIVPLDEIEFVMVQRALKACEGNQSQAARLLQVSRDQLRYRVKRYRELGKLSDEFAADDA